MTILFYQSQNTLTETGQCNTDRIYYVQRFAVYIYPFIGM